MAMCLPTTVSLITNTFPKGQWRTTCFAMNGMAQPLGYALGLVLGGVFTDSVGWRWAYWIMAILNACVSVMAVWALPNVAHPAAKSVVRRMAEDVDWVGVVGLSASLGIVMYILASELKFSPLLLVSHIFIMAYIDTGVHHSGDLRLPQHLPSLHHRPSNPFSSYFACFPILDASSNPPLPSSSHSQPSLAPTSLHRCLSRRILLLGVAQRD